MNTSPTLSSLIGDGAPNLVRAAQYVRMSTEHQQYSTENQADVIREYATRRGFEIVRTYADDGKSGLRIEGREALKRRQGFAGETSKDLRQSSSDIRYSKS